MSAARRWWRALRPAALPADGRERLRVALGAGLGLLFTALCTQGLQRWGLSGPQATWLVAPLGASAVLVYGVPSSPLAQPWSVLGGNTLSALVGVACVQALGASASTAALAVALAISVMFLARCLHPPGGASALLVSLLGVSEWSFALMPVAVNSLLLVLFGIAWNTATRRPYPHALSLPDPALARDEESRAVAADLDAVLTRHNQVLDISREDLQALLSATRSDGHRRRMAALTCADVMQPKPRTVRAATALDEAWRLMVLHGIKALPVVDGGQHVVGILTRGDFMRSATNAAGEWFDAHVRAMQVRTGRGSGERVGDLMTRRVRVASEHRHLSELVPLFAGSGHAQLPVIDAQDRLVGLIRQSDVIAALARVADASGAPDDPAPDDHAPDAAAPHRGPTAVQRASGTR